MSDRQAFVLAASLILALDDLPVFRKAGQIGGFVCPRQSAETERG
jgi:hypothetical protein